jgi:hypothetical protein
MKGLLKEQSLIILGEEYGGMSFVCTETEEGEFLFSSKLRGDNFLCIDFTQNAVSLHIKDTN